MIIEEDCVLRWVSNVEKSDLRKLVRARFRTLLLLLLLSHFSRVWLCDPIDGSPPGSAVPEILQARTLEWVAISFSSAWKWKWSCSVVSNSSRPHGLQPTRLLHPWDFPGKSTGVGCHCLWFRALDFSKYMWNCLFFIFCLVKSHYSANSLYLKTSNILTIVTFRFPSIFHRRAELFHFSLELMPLVMLIHYKLMLIRFIEPSYCF